MINPFKKKRDEVIDLVELRKRGIIKDKVYATSSPSSTESIEENTGDFIGEFSGVANDTNVQSASSEDAPGLKNKLDDFEYKIDAFGDRIYKLIQRIEVLEKKLERLEGRR